MRVLYYCSIDRLADCSAECSPGCPTGKGFEERLRCAVEAVVGTGELEIYLTIESFRNALIWSGADVVAAVVCAATEKEFSSFVSMREELEGIRLILILPDEEPETISNAHLLTPRFLSYIDSDFIDVAAVLGNILRNARFLRRYLKNMEACH